MCVALTDNTIMSETKTPTGKSAQLVGKRNWFHSM